MKKLLLVLAGACVILFTSCLSAKVRNFDYKERAEMGTPENSVIFIGYYQNNSEMHWSQSDSEYAPDFQKLEAPYIISAPVAPGSRYRLVYCYGQYRTGQYITYWNPTYSLQENYFDIKIPDEPGIYFFGYYNGGGSVTNGKNVEQTGLFSSTVEKAELYCLKEALKVYKGTAWEPVIKARIEELN